jgi:serine/threonine protein kinase
MLNLGAQLKGRYRVDRLLEIGALDGQYGGWDIQANIPVLIKELMPQPELDEELLVQLQADFERDAEALSQLTHPYIVHVLDYFCSGADDAPVPNAYLILAAVPGQTLSELMARQRALKERRVIAWADQLLDALAYAHDRGICHRDIKPENIIITPDDRAMLTNFEILALWNRSDPRTWTAKRVMGTPAYAPPERWGMRTAQIDPRSDIYSLGATLYHVLTGEQPLTAGERTSNPYQFLQVKALSPRVSAHTQAVVLKAMSLPQDKRYQTASEMAEALLTDPAEKISAVGKAQPPAIFLPSQRSQISWKPVLGLALSTLVLIIAGFFGLYLGNRTGRPTPPNTPELAETAPTAMPIATPSLDSTIEMPVETQTDEVPTQVPETMATATAVTTTPDSATPDASPSLAPTPPPAWQLLVEDSFEDNANQWLISEYEDDWGTTVREISGGAYQWTINAEQPVGRWCTPELGGDDGTVTDFLVTVEAQRLSGPAAAAYGLILRHVQGSYYLFSVRDDGYYQFSLWFGYDWQAIIDWTETPSVRSGEVNHLAVLAQDGTFELYINETSIATATDDQIPAGEVGLSISTPATDGEARFVFDNFNLWRP